MVWKRGHVPPQAAATRSSEVEVSTVSELDFTARTSATDSSSLIIFSARRAFASGSTRDAQARNLAASSSSLAGRSG